MLKDFCAGTITGSAFYNLYTVTTVAGTVPEQLHSIFNYIRAEYSTDKVVAFNRLGNLTLIWSSKGVFCDHLLSTECDN